MIRVVQIVVDDREPCHQYDREEPFFGTAPTALFQGLEECADLELHVLSCVRSNLPAPRRIGKNTTFHLVQVPHWAFLKTFYLPTIVKIRKVIRRIRPNLVHGQGTERYCALAAVHSGYRSVITVHGIMQQMAKQMNAGPLSFYGLTSVLEKHAFRSAGGVICNSEYSETQVRGFARRIWRVPNAVAADFFAPSTRVPSEVPTLLNAGTIAEHKGQLELLRLAEKLFEQGLKFRLRFAGRHSPHGAYGKSFDEKLRQLQGLGDVGYLGSLDQTRLLAAMDNATALVHTPSEESFGLVIAEALARNLEVFSFAAGGVVQTAAGQPAARFVDSGDWTGLQTKLAHWLNAGAPRSIPSQPAIRDLYHPRSVAQRHMGIYREVAGVAAQR